MELGFPEDKQEFEAEGWLEQVVEEFDQWERGRNLKSIRKGGGVALYDYDDFLPMMSRVMFKRKKTIKIMEMTMEETMKEIMEMKITKDL